MKVLFIVGGVCPSPGTNVQLMDKLARVIGADHDVRVLSLTYRNPERTAVKVFSGRKIYGLTDEAGASRLKRARLSVLSHFVDPSGNSDYLTVRNTENRLREIEKEFPFDLAIACSEPFPAAVALSKCRNQAKALYLMDPPECICNAMGTRYRNKTIWKALRSIDLLISSPFIIQAMRSKFPNAMKHCAAEEVGFPMIEKGTAERASSKAAGRIKLLFTGWMCVEIRSPKYFLDILSRLDERFTVTFMGRECEKLTERFAIQTKAELITLPQQPYGTALQAMADADVLINIGNSVPVHMPSKTLEYINTGKPFVNFYKLDDCPTLYYTERYPLCLNLSEQDQDLDAAAARFAEFCVRNKGKTVDRTYIEEMFIDCTPEYIAQKILDAIGE